MQILNISAAWPKSTTITSKVYPVLLREAYSLNVYPLVVGLRDVVKVEIYPSYSTLEVEPIRMTLRTQERHEYAFVAAQAVLNVAPVSIAITVDNKPPVYHDVTGESSGGTINVSPVSIAYSKSFGRVGFDSTTSNGSVSIEPIKLIME